MSALQNRVVTTVLHYCIILSSIIASLPAFQLHSGGHLEMLEGLVVNLLSPEKEDYDLY